MPGLRLERLSKHYGAFTAVDGLSLEVPHGSFLSLVGPSGCGKTTVLRMIAGLIAPDGGRIRIGDDDITSVPVHRRQLGLVFQSYALFPHLTVAENVAFGLKQRGVTGSEAERRVVQALSRVRLEALALRYPRELSGGQQQRAALARALVVEPRILLLDEPFSNLDALLREELRIEIKRLQHELRVTTLFVTHDQAEALSMADQVAVMNHGRLEQLASPERLYREPATTFIAHFIGRANLLPGRIEQAATDASAILSLAGGARVQARSSSNLPAGARVRMVLRQEAIRLVDAPVDEANGLPATIALASFTGAQSQYVIRLDDATEIQALVPSGGRRWEPGQRVFVAWRAEDASVLPDHGGAPGSAAA